MTGETYLDIMKWAEAETGLRMLTPEYEVVAALFDVAQITPLELLRRFSGSSSNFFKLLKNLESKGVISGRVNPDDHRSRIYCISDEALAVLRAQWHRYHASGREEIYGSTDPQEAIRTYTGTIRRAFKLVQFTCEFQIMLYLKSSPGLTNLHVSDLIEVSQAKFNLSIASLTRSGHVFFGQDQSDRRRKLYHLCERDVGILDHLERRIFSWLDTRANLLDSPTQAAISSRG